MASDEEFDKWFDEIHGDGDIAYSPAEVLKETEPIAYRDAKLDYEDYLEESKNE